MKNKSLKHWIVLVCCCGLAASSVGAVTNTVGVFYSPVCEDLHVLRGTFAFNSTLTMIATALMVLLVPSLLKKMNFKTLILIGTILTTGTTFLMSLTSSIMIFNILGFVKGIGASLYHILVITAIINHWFSEKNGLATSIVLSFSGVAGAILSPILTNCIGSVGWRMTYVILAIITGALSIPALVYPFSLDPRDNGLLPYGFKGTVETKQKEEGNFQPLQGTFILYLVVVCFFTMLIGMPSHFPGYSETLKAAPTVGALMLSACMIGNILSKLIVGALADVLGIVKSVYVMIVTIIISIVMMLLIHQDISLIVSAGLFGAAYGICAVGLSLMTKQFFGEDSYIKAYSIVCFISNIGGAIALTVIAYMYDLFHTYTIALVALVVLLVVNAVVIKYLNSRVKKIS